MFKELSTESLFRANFLLEIKNIHKLLILNKLIINTIVNNH